MILYHIITQRSYEILNSTILNTSHEMSTDGLQKSKTPSVDKIILRITPSILKGLQASSEYTVHYFKSLAYKTSSSSLKSKRSCFLMSAIVNHFISFIVYSLYILQKPSWVYQKRKKGDRCRPIT